MCFGGGLAVAEHSAAEEQARGRRWCPAAAAVAAGSIAEASEGGDAAAQGEYGVATAARDVKLAAVRQPRSQQHRVVVAVAVAAAVAAIIAAVDL